ncbi:SurA N-terminal domain-containing protein [Streptomyces sp. JJ36]|uniref:SurA N-terminal domain-containing protein n=1 Tax=Streptomyces sp. JJ36 TaxID=2736645 RepID=UPI001F29D549|nr:SurA N-terminal domain-containing protein [Streptomyces sp. JJ36]MCF6526121.1 SurA N-terminal domain-containing protein [Streptomyces sp. JJ36]
MQRRRSALTVSTAAALLAAAPLLTACGSDARPGAAAVVDGDRITMAQLQSRVGAVRDAQQERPEGEAMIQRTGSLTRATLDGMIRHRIVERAAEDAGVTVSRQEVQRARDGFERQTGGSKGFEEALLRQQGVAPSDADAWVWMQVAVQKIARASGVNPGTPQGNQALTETFSRISEEMDIDVNPRYGEWSTERASLAPEEVPWLNDVSGKQAQREQHA